MTTYVLRNGKLVDKRRAAVLRNPVHNVISDNISDTWHPATGKKYDSKSAFRQATKAAGCVEVGTETQRDRRNTAPIDVRADVEHAIRKLNSGYRPQVDTENYSGDGWQ